MSKIIVLMEQPFVSDWNSQFLREKCVRAGISPEDVIFETISPERKKPTEQDVAGLLGRLKELNDSVSVIVTLDEQSLQLVTGRKSQSKWHLSPLDVSLDVPQKKCIPTWHPNQVKKDWSLGLYVEMAFLRAARERDTREYVRKPKRFLLNPPLEELYPLLDSLVGAEYLAVDIETGRGQINTVGFAWSESDAVAIQVLPARCSAETYFRLWSHIAKVLRGPSRKIMQNGLYEILYFARYGIQLENFFHDTMTAQKFLWPELDKGLDNVGRIYTNEPYWKDTGRVSAEEGKQRDWANIRDWTKHFEYNCLDTTGSYEACFKQREDLLSVNKLNLFDNYVMKLAGPVREMCIRGLPLRKNVRMRLVRKYTDELETLHSKLSKPINTASPKQKLSLLKGKGYIIPKKRDKVTGAYRESTDALSLAKLRIKYPDDVDIPLLQEIAELSKALSSYLQAEEDPLTGNIHFSMDFCSTETGRMSSHKDPWDRGFNAQTIPSYAKELIGWEDED